VFEQALALSPDYAKAHYGRGVSLTQQGELETAIAAFETASTYLPDFGHARYAQGLALANLARYDEARAQLQVAINLYVSQGNPEWATAAQQQLNRLENL